MGKASLGLFVALSFRFLYHVYNTEIGEVDNDRVILVNISCSNTVHHVIVVHYKNLPKIV